jgi:hypothetical protein
VAIVISLDLEGQEVSIVSNICGYYRRGLSDRNFSHHQKNMAAVKPCPARREITTSPLPSQFPTNVPSWLTSTRVKVRKLG